MDLYDKDGNLVEGAKTKEEVEAELKTATESAVTEAVDKYKKENPPAVEKTAEEKATEEAAAATGDEPLAKLAKTVADLEASIRSRDIKEAARVYANGDKTKQDEIIKNFDKLTGYEATPEGLLEQAEAAAKMAGIDTEGVSVGDVSSTGGGRSVNGTGGTAPSAQDAEVQKALGITPEDAKKYGPAAEAAGFTGEANKE